MGNCGGGSSKKKDTNVANKLPVFGAEGTQEKKDQKIKLCMAGEVGVGKSLFYHTYFGTTARFTNTSTSASGDNNCKPVEYPNIGKILVSIWDTAGQERYASITKIFFKGSDGIFILFDVTSSASLKRVEEYWLKEIEKEIDLRSIKICLVGNKTDLPNRVVSLEEAKAFASKHNMLYFEASALKGLGVNESVDGLVTAIFEKRPLNQSAL